MNRQMNFSEQQRWEMLLLEFCSPTLAGIKAGNLFNISHSGTEELAFEITRLNRMFRGKGIKAEILNIKGNRALIYVYRETILQNILKKEGIWELLETFGYAQGKVADVLTQLKKRLKEKEEFPHEIGIFLDYPICDVKGFIEHTGKDFLFCGYWKVYGNVEDSKRRFQSFDSCTECFISEYEKGISIQRLAVAG